MNTVLTQNTAVKKTHLGNQTYIYDGGAVCAFMSLLFCFSRSFIQVCLISMCTLSFRAIWLSLHPLR